MWHNLWPTRLSLLPALAALAGLAACSTPYRPPVVVHGSATFPGIASSVAEAGTRPADIDTGTLIGDLKAVSRRRPFLEQGRGERCRA